VTSAGERGADDTSHASGTDDADTQARRRNGGHVLDPSKSQTRNADPTCFHVTGVAFDSFRG
jgi:hypothetical protein